MNCKIGFMSSLVITSIVILFLLVSGNVEAEPQNCIGLCKMLFDCSAACIKMGYVTGQCVGSKNPDICCCNH
ncbi:PREDICTED: putative defensin-like protein 73 [Camelina sativa]|uniref:Defensin-like protein 73 n=1 Tax=Camelina sativa TaxID=90675 RepID=A0ABM1RCR4_CAMSA|nr:PREDICTED: putative defensin-like protein 73 [Camelina sativa]